MEQSVALVAVENVAYHFDIFYSYTIPENLKSKAEIGSRVLVPFGRSKTAKRQGVIFGFAEKQNNIRYKDIISVLDDTPFFTEENLKLASRFGTVQEKSDSIASRLSDLNSKINDSFISNEIDLIIKQIKELADYTD